jgi:hypothetical protein
LLADFADHADGRNGIANGLRDRDLTGFGNLLGLYYLSVNFPRDLRDLREKKYLSIQKPKIATP